MEVIIVNSSQEVSERGGDICCTLLKKKPHAVLGLATGSTPLALYQELILRYKKGTISFQKVITFNLDEYIGLPPSHHQSYRYFMNENLFKHIDIDMNNTHVPDGMAENPMDVGPQYEKMIRDAGGIDLQILGIGANGHIGFNEPTSSLGSRTRIKTLTNQTFQDNRRFFQEGEFQPHLAITMGIGTITEARRILLMAFGEHKASAIANAVESPLSALWPASILQMHPNTTFLIDEAAASKLKMRDYYKEVLSRQDALTKKFGDMR